MIPHVHITQPLLVYIQAANSILIQGTLIEIIFVHKGQQIVYSDPWSEVVFYFEELIICITIILNNINKIHHLIIF